VVEEVSILKARIRALDYVNKTYNPQTTVNTYIKYMTLIGSKENNNNTNLVVSGNNKNLSFNIEEDIDYISDLISDLFYDNDRKYFR